MKSSRKIIILMPPLLIGITILLFIFTHEYRQSLESISVATTTEDVVVTEPVPTPVPLPPPVQADPPVADWIVACPADVRQCPDGSFVGRTGPDCEFATCQSGVVEECTPESRLAEVCAEIYAPVCGAVQVECVTEPCGSIPVTFSNDCFACMNERVLSYRGGVCTEDE